MQNKRSLHLANICIDDIFLLLQFYTFINHFNLSITLIQIQTCYDCGHVVLCYVYVMICHCMLYYIMICYVMTVFMLCLTCKINESDITEVQYNGFGQLIHTNHQVRVQHTVKCRCYRQEQFLSPIIEIEIEIDYKMMK